MYQFNEQPLSISLLKFKKRKCIFYVHCWCSEISLVHKDLIKEERKVYRRILGPVCDNEKENWRILTDKEIYAIVKNLP
jgi:hypothetical protein